MEVPPSSPAKPVGPLEEEYIEAQRASLGLVFGVAGAVGGASEVSEDRCLAISDLGDALGIETGFKDSLFAVLDGHDGSKAVDYTRDNLPYEIRSTGFLESNPGLAVQQAVLEIDRKFALACSENGDSSGTCVLVCMVRGQHLVVAWAGDSRAVMYGGTGEVIDLSQDHTVARNDAELERLAEAGVFVKRGRVLGVLQPSRSVGDLDLKRRAPLGVIAECEVRNYVIPLMPDTNSFIVLASDGLYDAMSSEEVVAMVGHVLQNMNGTREFLSQEAADSLVKYAQQRTADDITVVVVLLWEP